MCNFITKGKKPTKYFLNLEKAKSSAKGMSCLIKDNGDSTINTVEILAEQRKFYSKLYRSDPSVQFQYRNESNIRVSVDQRESLEGLITEPELAAALKQLNKNSAPGADGPDYPFFTSCFGQKLNIPSYKPSMKHMKSNLFTHLH